MSGSKDTAGMLSLTPLKIALIYLVVAALWIAFTDEILDDIITDADTLSQFQTYKGWFYVLVTTLGLYVLVREYKYQVQAGQRRLEKIRSKHEADLELIDVLFERVPIFITVYDPDLEEFRVNNEFEKVVGYGNEEVQEINLLKVCFPDFDERERVVKFFENPGLGWKEFTITAKDGREIETSWTNVRLRDDTSVGIGIDMTEIKATENELRESRQLLQKTFESLEEAVILVDPETRTIIDTNQAVEKIFGYSKEELLGKSTRVLHINEEKHSQFDEIGTKALEEDGVFRTEFKMEKKDGSLFHSDHTVTLVYDEEGEVDRVVSVIRDITEKKERRNELKRRQERLLRSQKIGNLGDWEFNVDSEEIYWSPMMYEIFERDPEEGPPSFDQLVSSYFEEDSEKHKKMVENAIQEGKAYDVDLFLSTDKGNEKYIRAIGIPQKNDSEEVVKLFGVIQDITDRKEMEIVLRENEQRLHTITNNVPGVVFRYQVNKDGSDELQYISEGAEEIWGFTKEEIKEDKDKIWDRIHRQDIGKVRESIEESAKELSVWNVEWRYIYPNDESLKWHRGKGVPHQQEDGAVVWDSIITDITQEKKIEEWVLQSTIEGEDRERKRIARELHDGIGQYLAASNMNFESMKKHVESLPDPKRNRFKTGLNLLKEAMQETRNIAHNLMPETLQDYGLEVAIESLVKDFENSAEVDIRFDADINENVIGNQVSVNIYRIVQEAVTNAIKHGKSSKISISLSQNDHRLICTIDDNGKGVPLDGQVEQQGIGVKNMKTRAKAISGEITFQSDPGKGMTINLEVPLEKVKEEVTYE